MDKAKYLQSHSRQSISYNEQLLLYVNVEQRGLSASSINRLWLPGSADKGHWSPPMGGRIEGVKTNKTTLKTL